MAKVRRICFLALLAAALFAAGASVYRQVFVRRQEFRCEPSGEVLSNPMTGFAAAADYAELAERTALVYVQLTWREWEPQEGVYDIDFVKEKFLLERWREAGKRVVFRFVCDEPGEEAHMDIPDWLYVQTGDGAFYDCEYGKGYSPDYQNELLIVRHAQAVKALGEAFGQDDFFCFVELGSLGHWGEWHVKYDEGIPRLPSEETCGRYVEPYPEAFPNARFLMRRPYVYTANYGMGVYNDMTGDRKSTEQWLGWLEAGGSYDGAETPLRYTACPSVWERSPVGGEFTSSRTMEELLSSDLEGTLELLDRSHMSFIGPKIPEPEEWEKWRQGAEQVLKRLGYRYGVSEAQITYDTLTRKLRVDAVLVNHGTAPLYFDWPLCFYVMDGNGEVLQRIPAEVKLTECAQGGTVPLRIETDCREWDRENVPVVAVGIEDPRTGEPAVALDMKCRQDGYRYRLNETERRD